MEEGGEWEVEEGAEVGVSVGSVYGECREDNRERRVCGWAAGCDTQRDLDKVDERAMHHR